MKKVLLSILLLSSLSLVGDEAKSSVDESVPSLEDIYKQCSTEDLQEAMESSIGSVFVRAAESALTRYNRETITMVKKRVLRSIGVSCAKDEDSSECKILKRLFLDAQNRLVFLDVQKRLAEIENKSSQLKNKHK